MLDIRIVLCSTDFSHLSERALMLATRICSHFSSRLALHHCVEAHTAQSVSNQETSPGFAPFDDEEVRKRSRSHLEAGLARVPSYVKRQWVLSTGQAHASILALAGCRRMQYYGDCLKPYEFWPKTASGAAWQPQPRFRTAASAPSPPSCKAT